MISDFEHFAIAAIAAMNASSRSIVVTDISQPDNPIAYTNAAFTAQTGYSFEEVAGRNIRFLQGVDTDRQVIAEIGAAVKAGVRIQRDVLNYRKDGTSFWNDMTIDPIHDATGMLTGFISVQANADAVHAANELRAEAEERLESIAGHIPGYIYRRVMHPDGSIALVYCSPSAGRLLGVDNADIADAFYSHVHPDDIEPLNAAIRSSAADMSIFHEEFRLLSVDGATHWMRSDAPPRRLKNGDIVWDGLAIEISAEKRWQNEIVDLALRDRLTDLLTRDAWREGLARQMASEDGGGCVLLYADIDGFRDLNDRLGQGIGDEILRRTAKRVSSVAASVSGLAGRLGSDEFGILVAGLSSDEALSRLAGELSAELARPIEVGAHLYPVAASVGAVLCPPVAGALASSEEAASEAMARAELALRWAKQAGLGGYEIYTAQRDDRVQNQAILARSLDGAIRNGELEVHYQPLVDLASGRIVSAEALVRWNHPTLGMQRPDLFIPLAEKSGLIVPLGYWVIEHVLRQRSLWNEGGLPRAAIAINVSGVQLMDPDFVSFVAKTLRSTRARAEDFEFELTEGLLIEASPLIMTSLHALRDMGFKIAIDDFGSGHATFRYLRDFPVDKLKIDQLFVRKLVLGSSDALIIRAIISLARSMDIRVVAEGIETEMQRDFLHREGCEIGQGYMFSLPLVAEDYAWMLAGGVTLPMQVQSDGNVQGNAKPLRRHKRGRTQ